MITISSTLLAACSQAIGCISPPAFIKEGINPATGKLTGIVDFFNSILRLVFIAGGLWAFINFIIAGFGFLGAGGDAKAVGKAWDRIWQSFVGLLFIVASFLLAAVVGLLLFKDPTAILQPTIGK